MVTTFASKRLPIAVLSLTGRCSIDITFPEALIYVHEHEGLNQKHLVEYVNSLVAK